MREIRSDIVRAVPQAGSATAAEGAVPAVDHEPPRFRVIPLDCEITAYAPDGDQPLF